MKKEYLILIALILILGAYLFLHKENKDNYVLPVIQKIEADQISKIILSSKDKNIEFRKKGDDWIINSEEYLASASDIQNMIDTFTTLKLTALVSEKGDKQRYELDTDQHVEVRVFKGEQPILEFSMGKTAPTFNHTFVMLKNDENIYHANGSFKSNFDKEMDDFRDKKVLDFKEESITQFSVEKEGLSKTFKASVQEHESSASKIKGSKTDEPKITWQSQDESMVDPKTITDLIASLSNLECEQYSYELTKKRLETESSPLCTISLETQKKIVLKIFKKEAQEQLLGISSMNNDAFELSIYEGQEILTKIDTLLGIKKEAAETIE